ncbi:MAG: hypothetical protein IJL18_09025, partial [Synergistaceae bacterium]|nr:hypothetical protein [Synergistaceae bacterium]
CFVLTYLTFIAVLVKGIDELFSVQTFIGILLESIIFTPIIVALLGILVVYGEHFMSGDHRKENCNE